MSSSKVLAEAQILCSGRYRVVVHKGHTYDDRGNILKHGEIVAESAWGKNLITYKGFETMLTNDLGFQIQPVLGVGNATPSLSDTVLDSYKGGVSTFVSMNQVETNVPDGSGYINIKRTFKFTFAPMSLGGGSMNLAEAGIVKNVGGAIDGSTPVVSRGLLLDGSGYPTTVPYDGTNEYVDLTWEFTFYLKAEVTGTVSIDVNGTPTNFDYTVRPMLFSTEWFHSLATDYVPAFLKLSLGDGRPEFSCMSSENAPGTLDGKPSGSFDSYSVPSSYSYGSYTPGTKYRDLTVKFSPSQGNFTTGMCTIGLTTADSGNYPVHLFQIGFDAKLPKDSTHSLEVTFRYSLDNK